jgi:hypothetical protein
MKKRRRGRDGRARASHGDEQVDYGIDKARERVADLLETFTHLELKVVVVSMPDPERDRARDRARSAAIVAGRLALFDEAVTAAREIAIDSFSRGGFSGTWAVTDMAVSVVSGRDRVAAAAALEEAVIAEVVEDLVDGDTLEILRSTADDLFRLRELPSPGSLSSFAAPPTGIVRGSAEVVLLVGYLVLCVVVSVIWNLGVGLIALAVGLVVVGAISRRRDQPET